MRYDPEYLKKQETDLPADLDTSRISRDSYYIFPSTLSKVRELLSSTPSPASTPSFAPSSETEGPNNLVIIPNTGSMTESTTFSYTTEPGPVSVSTTTPGLAHLAFEKTTAEMGPDDLQQLITDRSFNNTTLIENEQVVIPAVTKYTFDENVDLIIAGVLVLLIFVGLIGNAVACYYFSKKKLKSLPSHLYTAITATDTCIALIAFPVAVALFNARHDPSVFEREIPCAIWAVLAYFLKRMSVFLVMMVSFTRAVATVLPFRRLTKFRNLSIPIGIYAVFIALMDVVFLSTGWFKTRFRLQESMCEIYPGTVKSGSIHTEIYSVALQLELAVPPLVVLISFIVCTVTLAIPKKTSKESFRRISIRKSQFRRATITIALFSGIFIACNIPAFVVQLDYLISTKVKKMKEFKDHRARKGVFAGWYAHLLTAFVLTLLNVAVNPCLYVMRMPECRRWLALGGRYSDKNGPPRRTMKRFSAASTVTFTTVTSITSFASNVYQRLSRAGLPETLHENH